MEREPIITIVRRDKLSHFYYGDQTKGILGDLFMKDDRVTVKTISRDELLKLVYSTPSQVQAILNSYLE